MGKNRTVFLAETDIFLTIQRSEDSNRSQFVSAKSLPAGSSNEKYM
jgi:hypothetical protein